MANFWLALTFFLQDRKGHFFTYRDRRPHCGGDGSSRSRRRHSPAARRLLESDYEI